MSSSYADWQDWTHCPSCMKRRYKSRKAARSALRQVSGRRMSVYPCPQGPGYHMGHLPRAVAQGVQDRHEYYADRMAA